MGLAESIAAAIKPRGGKCTVKDLRNSMDAKDLAALDEALANPKISGTAILEGLHAEGYKITRSPLERHRRGECACGPR